MFYSCGHRKRDKPPPLADIPALQFDTSSEYTDVTSLQSSLSMTISQSSTTSIPGRVDIEPLTIPSSLEGSEEYVQIISTPYFFIVCFIYVIERRSRVRVTRNWSLVRRLVGNSSTTAILRRRPADIIPLSNFLWVKISLLLLVNLLCSDDDMTSSQGSVCTVVAGTSRQMDDIVEESDEILFLDNEMIEPKMDSGSESDDEDNPRLKW